MERIPEHDLMDDTEQAEAYAATDFSEAHDNFVKHFSNCFPDFSQGSVLDMGCGPADVTIRFAKRYPEVLIKGIDGAGAMLKIGLMDIESHGLSERIQLHKCFLPDKELLNTNYDAIISNNLLHHLKEPVVLWDTIKNCVKRGSPVFVMDLYRPENTDTAKELVELHAVGAPDILKKDFYNSLLASYNTNEVENQLKQSDLAFLTIETISDRHMIIWG